MEDPKPVLAVRAGWLARRNYIGYSYFSDPRLQAQGTGEVFFRQEARLGSNQRLRVLLGRLNVSVAPEDMNLRD